MKLVIAEKRELAQKIAQALSNNANIKANQSINAFEAGDYTVAWCSGHILTLKEPEDYDPKYADRRNLDHLVIKEMKRGEYKKIDITTPIGKRYASLYKSLPSLINKASVIIHAGDPDDEGQRIVDNVLNFFKCPKSTPIKRVAISDTNPRLVNRAFENLEDNNDPKWRSMANMGLARAIADQLFGLNLSRCLTAVSDANRFLSIGRVQTPTLALVVKRYRDNKTFQKKPFYEIYSSFQFNQAPITAKLSTHNLKANHLDNKSRFQDKIEAQSYIDSINAIQNDPKPYIKNYTNSEKEHDHPLVFDLLTLQIEAEERFKIDPTETLSITQSLRDNHSAITYNRSDNQYLNLINHSDAAETLACIAYNMPSLSDSINKADISILSRVWNDKEVAKSAHHGIIPTMSKVANSELTTSEKIIYEMISRRYIAQFYPKKRSEILSFDIIYDSFVFKKSTSVTCFQGWAELMKGTDEKEEKSDSEEGLQTDEKMPSINEGDQGSYNNSELKEGTTTAPPLYTKSSLLKALPNVDSLVENPQLKAHLEKENRGKPPAQKGIGTPATRAGIVDKIFDIGYVKLDSKKKVIPTSLGEEIFDVLPESAKKVDTTAMWQFFMGSIGKGEMNVNDFIDLIIEGVEEDVAELKSKNVRLSISAKKTKCSCENGYARQIVSKKGKKIDKWWRCDSCNSSFPDIDDRPDLKKKSNSEVITKNSKGESFNCLSCESLLSLKKSKNGPFWACTGFPKCKYTYQDVEDKPRLEPCQREGCKGVLSLIYSKKTDSHFFTCSQYRGKPSCQAKYQIDSKTGKPIYIHPSSTD